MRKETTYSVMVGRVIDPNQNRGQTREWGGSLKTKSRVEIREHIKSERERYARNGWEIDIMFHETTTKAYW